MGQRSEGSTQTFNLHASSSQKLEVWKVLETRLGGKSNRLWKVLETRLGGKSNRLWKVLETRLGGKSINIHNSTLFFFLSSNLETAMGLQF